MVSFSCSSSSMKMNLDTFVVIFITSSIFQDCLSQVLVTTYSSKSSEVLRCNISSQNTYASWSEVASDGSTTVATIYEYNRGSEITPTSPPEEGKYSNFLYQYTEDKAFDLVIENVNKDDGGNYRCIVIPLETIEYQVKVEALPLPMTIICSNTVTCDEANGMSGSSFNCTCTASEVYPGDLQLEWSGASHTAGQTQETEAGDYFDLTSKATVNPTEASDEVTCTVTGYQSEEIQGTVNSTYEFAPPECTLLIDCSSAMVTCNCRGQSPTSITYIFYDQNMESIGISNNNQMDVAPYIVPGENNTFSCRGCNGIFYGDSSLASNTTDCPATTTTPTMTLMTTSPPESDNLGLIIGVVIAAVVVGGGAIGFSVYWFGIRTPSDDRGRKKGSNTTGNNFDPPGGADNNTVTASTNETTNSAAPVYGVVNKSTKKKSDNTDGNGVNSKLQSEPDQVEYAAVNKPKPDPQPAPRSSKPPGNNTEPEKVELQYADIDHSNRGRSNEIRQPADEPTEYATVQSVIV